MSADAHIKAASRETAPLELLRPTCGRHLETILPLLSPLPLTALDTITMGDLLALSGRGDDMQLTLVLAWLFCALNEGSVCMKLDPQPLADMYPPGQANAASHHLQDFLGELAAGGYAGLIDEAGSLSGAPLVRVKGQLRDAQPDLLYFQRYFHHEVRLKSRLEHFLEGGVGPLCAPHRIDGLLAALWRPDRVIRLGLKRTPMVADPWQQAALRLMMTRGLSVISGGPGTGKTSLMVNLLRLLTDCGVDPGEIRLTAPTGRAAQRMREALQLYLPGIEAMTRAEESLLDLEAGTLHKLLHYRRSSQGFYYHEGHPLPARAVIVDEVSMIDVGMLDHLLQAIDPKRTRLVLLGDKDQLPSVQAGAVFSSLIPQATNKGPHNGGDMSEDRSSHRFSDHLTVLKTSYRSGKRLLALAAAVNAGRMPTVAPISMAAALGLPADSFARLLSEKTGDGPAEASGEDFAAALSYWVDHHYAPLTANGGADYLQLAAKASGHSTEAMADDSFKSALAKLFEHLARARILTVARHGPLGCVAINRMVMGHLVKRHGLARDPGTGLFCGAPVLITRNDYARQLFNGDVGVSLRDGAGALRVTFQRGAGFITAPLMALTDWEPAFATTVHKSQGSEYAHVLLVFPGDPHHRLLTREILYTGITRARERLLLLATDQELQTALAQRIKRTSGLSW